MDPKHIRLTINSLYYNMGIGDIYSQLSRCCTAWGPVFRYYRVVPPRWGLVSSVLFTIVPMSNEIKNTWFILLYLQNNVRVSCPSNHFDSKLKITFFAKFRCKFVAFCVFSFSACKQ